MRYVEKLCETLAKISGQLRGPLGSLGGSQTSERGHWAFSENCLKITRIQAFMHAIGPTLHKPIASMKA